MDLLRYRKFFVYILTFMAYTWSGYGAGLLTNLRDAVLAAESVFGDFFENVITVARKIKDIHEVFDAALEENCVFRCPYGVTPKPDRNHVPQSNGCGSLGIETQALRCTVSHCVALLESTHYRQMKRQQGRVEEVMAKSHVIADIIGIVKVNEN